MSPAAAWTSLRRAPASVQRPRRASSGVAFIERHVCAFSRRKRRTSELALGMALAAGAAGACVMAAGSAAARPASPAPAATETTCSGRLLVLSARGCAHPRRRRWDEALATERAEALRRPAAAPRARASRRSLEQLLDTMPALSSILCELVTSRRSVLIWLCCASTVSMSSVFSLSSAASRPAVAGALARAVARSLACSSEDVPGLRPAAQRGRGNEGPGSDGAGPPGPPS
mmetsp:Transcript_41129/g.89821  ORF Transcript_41129/g.89821 Transcript_41129/m.89821 type:complete len:231 (-) Transcript_41129:994-1686(-)